MFNASGNAPYTFQNNSTSVSQSLTLNTGGTEVTSGYGFQVASNVVGDTTFQQNSGGGSLEIRLGQGQTWQNNSSAYALIVNVPIVNGTSVGANSALTTNGVGTIVLGAANTFPGGLTVSAGTLRATNASALSSGAVTVNGGATLDIRAAITKNISNSGTVSVGAGGNLSASSLGGALALGGVSGTTATFTSTLGSGTLSLGSFAATGNTNLSLPVNTQIGATGALNFTGASNLITLTGVAASSSYTLLQGSTLSGTSGLSLTGAGVGNATIVLGSTATVGRTSYEFASSATALLLNVTGTIFNLTWDSTVSSGTWNENGSAVWLQDNAGSPVVFYNNDNVTFGSAATVSVPVSVAPGTMAISNGSGSVDLSGAGVISATTLSKSGAGTATIANSGTVASGVTVSGGSLTTTGPLTVTAGGLSTGAGAVYTGSGAVTISAGGLSVTAGTATLGATGSITGGITVNGGRLTLDAAQTVSGAVAVSGAGTLALNSGTLGTGGLSLDGGTVAAGASATGLANALTVGGGGATIDNGSAFTLSGAITGSSNTLTKTGAGNLTISSQFGGSSGGSQAMNLVVSGGSLTLSGAVNRYVKTGTFNGNVSLTSGTLQLAGDVTGSGTIATSGVTGIRTENNASSGTMTIGNPVTLDGTVTLLANASNVLKFDGIIGGSGAVTGTGNGIVWFNAAGPAAASFAGTLTVSQTHANASTQVTTQALGNATQVTVNANAARTSLAQLVISNASAGEFAGVITGAGIVGIESGAKPTFSGTNTYSGGTLLSVDVGIKNGAALGTGQIQATGANARVVWDGAATTGTVANNLSTGTVSSHVLAFAPGSGKTIVLTGSASGVGQLKVSGGGTLNLTQLAGNSSTGGIEIGTGGVLTNGSNLGSGTINFGTGSNSSLIAASSLSISNPFTIGSGVSTGYTANLDTNGYAMTISSAIVDKAGNVNGGLLNKLGSGTLTLAGAGGYGGATSVSAGTLLVNGTLGGLGAVTVANGAALGGGGRIAGMTTVRGAVTPGNSIGTLTVANDLTWVGAASPDAATDWVFELGSGNASDLLAISGVGSDFLKDSSTGSVFRFNFGGSTQLGTFTLISWDGTTDFVAGDFSYTNLGGGNTAAFQVDANSLVVAVSAPEPGTLALLGAGLVTIAGVGRRRQRRR